MVWVVLAFGLASCAGKTPSVAEFGSSVRLQYSLEANGAVVIHPGSPADMVLTIGEGKLPAAFEKNLVGLKPGDVKTIALKPEEAFGPARRELIGKVQRAQLPPGEIKEGTVLTAGSFSATIVKIMDDGSVVIDRNHPLAGKNLIYKVRVTSVE